MIRALACAALALCGCYDLDGLETGEVGLRLVGATGRPAGPGALQLDFTEAVAGDLQLLALERTRGDDDPAPTLDGWTFLRATQPCSGAALFLYHRTARGPEDAQLSVDVPLAVLSGSALAALAVALRGVDPALPFGPIDLSVSAGGPAISIAAPIRPDEAWVGFAGAADGSLSVSLPGMPEISANGYVSFLYGTPMVDASRMVSYGLSSGARCVGLAVMGIFPR